MAIEIRDDFIRLWDSKNASGIRIDALGGPEDNLRITGSTPVEISSIDYGELTQALKDFRRCGFFNGAY